MSELASVHRPNPPTEILPFYYEDHSLNKAPPGIKAVGGNATGYTPWNFKGPPSADPKSSQEHVETENNPSQEPPSQTATTGDFKFRLTPGPSITSYTAIVAMEASNPHLNKTIRPNHRGQLVITAKDEPTKTYLEQQENNLCSNIPPSSLSRDVKGKPEEDPTNWRPSTKDLALLTSPSAFGAHSAPKNTLRSHFNVSGVRSLATTKPAAQVQRSVGFAAADNTPLPTVLPGIKQSPAALTVEDPIMLGMIDVPTDFSELQTAREQTANTASIHVSRVERNHLQLNITLHHSTTPPNKILTLPELSSSPAPKPQRPPKPPPKAKRSPTHTPRTPSPLKLNSPTNSPTVTQPKKPEPNPSSSAPITHTPNISYSLKEFPNITSSTVTSISSASRPSKYPSNIDSSEYDLSACLMDDLLAAISNILRNFLRSCKIKFTQ
ncbi:soluble scavenger receptor cysteine-rich domain-containing protein SSC5D-like [Palaemon carinicauda]|uniref:soluble scavenger receptor cysteine-rich domain-containing protein SSC5D-like n=1 Tax=Palaemon carinicauda TaxID=392227 RepID=UPI0035B5DFA0